MSVPAVTANGSAALSNLANNALTTSGAGSSSGASNPNSAQASSGTDNTLNYNEFLQLLVAQLKNQDPTNPTDPTQFVSQLASFSSVEQQVNTNSILNALLTQTAIAEAPSLAGQTMTSPANGVSGQVASVQITSSGPQAVLTNGQTLALGSGIQIS
jgi:flagellar basal-body rod modification protein FlgD